MRTRLFGIALSLLLFAGEVRAQGVVGPGVVYPYAGGGGGSSTITSGSTVTSGCVAGGVLRSISNKVECGAGLTYASNVLTVQRVNLGDTTHFLAQSAGSITLETAGTLRLNAGGSTGLGGYLDMNFGSGYLNLVGYGSYHAMQFNYGDRSNSVINSSFLFTTNPDGAPVAGYGTGLVLRGESSTTNSQDMIRLAGVWTDATHASRSAAMVFDVVNGAAALAEVGRFNAVGGLKIATGTKPTCDSTYRGTLYYVAGGAGVADTYEVCKKDAGDSYAWASIF